MNIPLFLFLIPGCHGGSHNESTFFWDVTPCSPLYFTDILKECSAVILLHSACHLLMAGSCLAYILMLKVEAA
jgi:hypothetical protein